MKRFVLSIATILLLSTLVNAEMLSVTQENKLKMCPKLENTEAINSCFDASTFEFLKMLVLKERAVVEDGDVASINATLALIYDIDLHDKLNALEYYKKACLYGYSSSCKIAEDIERRFKIPKS